MLSLVWLKDMRLYFRCVSKSYNLGLSKADQKPVLYLLHFCNIKSFKMFVELSCHFSKEK